MNVHAQQMAAVRGLNERKLLAAEQLVGKGSAAVVVWTGTEKCQLVIVRDGEAKTIMYERRNKVGRRYGDLPTKWANIPN